VTDTIYIAGLSYQIKYVGLINDDANQMGEVNYKEQVIRIKSGLTKERKVQVLLHEILHCADEALGFPLGMDEDATERLIQQFSAILHQALMPYLTLLIPVNKK
jgi:hypothetical protein